MSRGISSKSHVNIKHLVHSREAITRTPGTGKTLLAKAVAEVRSRCSFFFELSDLTL